MQKKRRKKIERKDREYDKSWLSKSGSEEAIVPKFSYLLMHYRIRLSPVINLMYYKHLKRPYFYVCIKYQFIWNDLLVRQGKASCPYRIRQCFNARYGFNVELLVQIASERDIYAFLLLFLLLAYNLLQKDFCWLIE